MGSKGALSAVQAEASAASAVVAPVHRFVVLAREMIA
jgi:hypothetical protein